MYAANIVPPLWSSTFDSGFYHMALAHWVGKYPEYARKVKSSKAYMILDNGAFEKAQVGLMELRMAADLVKADEIVLPDVVGDGKATLETSWTASEYLKGHRIMFVPQGATHSEWARCLDVWMDKWPEDRYMSIGISSLRDKDGKSIVGSKTKNLEAALKFDRPIHILGVADPHYFATELLSLAYKNAARGFDTSTAFAQGARGKLLTPNSPKIHLGDPDQYTGLSQDNRRLIVLNMEILHDWASTGNARKGVKEVIVRRVSGTWLRFWAPGFADIRECMKACGMPPGRYALEGGDLFPTKEGDLEI